MANCKLCGIELQTYEVEYCLTCRIFLDWKYKSKIKERLGGISNENKFISILL
jgi:hypothetical protein